VANTGKRCKLAVKRKVEALWIIFLLKKGRGSSSGGEFKIGLTADLHGKNPRRLKRRDARASSKGAPRIYQRLEL
jgi:hypothetical protein